MRKLLSKLTRSSSKDSPINPSFEPFTSPNYKPTDLEPLKYLLEASHIEISHNGKRFEPKITHKRTNHIDITIKMLLETDPKYNDYSYIYDYFLKYLTQTKFKSHGSGINRKIHHVEVTYHREDESLKYIYDILHILNHR